MLGAVAIDEVFALKRHSVLHRDAAAQRFDPFDVAVGDRLAMIEEPVQPGKGNFAIDFLIDVQRAVDRFVVGCVQTKRPTILDEVTDDGLELGFHCGRHVRTRLEEIFEIRRRVNQHLARSVHSIKVVARAGLRQLCPLTKIRQLLLRLLREQVVRQAQRHLAAFVQRIDDFVVVRIVLKSTAGVNRAGHAEAIELAHEVARRIHLIFTRQLRPLGQCGGIKDARIGPGDKQSGGTALLVALDFATARRGRIFRIANGAERRAVQKSAIVKMQDENRRVGRGSVDLFQSRHAPFGELKLRPTADHAHPLRWRCALRLLLQHPQRIRQRRHAVPTQLHVVVKPAADRMHVRVVEAGNHCPATEIDDFGLRRSMAHDFFVRADGEKLAVLNRHCLCERAPVILSRDTAIQQNQFRLDVHCRQSASSEQVGDSDGCG